MNCTVLQRRLLSAEHPEQPSADLKSHLAQCPSCRAWHRRLVQMERLVPLLPIPPSTARDAFLQRLTGPSRREAIADPTTLWRSTLIAGPKERALRKVSLAFALAAALLVFALAWWSWPRGPLSGSELLKQEQVRLEERLGNSMHADTSKERLLRLARLAEEIHVEARKLVDNSEKLEQRARFYARVVGEHLLEQARQLPPDERRRVLTDIASRLSNTESEASRLSAQLKGASPRSAAAFDQIALASRKGERDVRALLNG